MFAAASSFSVGISRHFFLSLSLLCWNGVEERRLLPVLLRYVCPGWFLPELVFFRFCCLFLFYFWRGGGAALRSTVAPLGEFVWWVVDSADYEFPSLSFLFEFIILIFLSKFLRR